MNGIGLSRLALVLSLIAVVLCGYWLTQYAIPLALAAGALGVGAMMRCPTGKRATAVIAIMLSAGVLLWMLVVVVGFWLSAELHF